MFDKNVFTFCSKIPLITSILIISIISFKSSFYYYIIKLTWVERPRLSNTLTACNSLSHPKSCGYLAFAHPRKFISKYQLKNINEMIFTVGFITLMKRWHLSNFMSIQCCYIANIFTSHLNNQEKWVFMCTLRTCCVCV